MGLQYIINNLGQICVWGGGQVSIPQEDLLYKLLAYWKFDETSGTTLYNSVTDSSNLTTNASINYTGKIDRGLYIDTSTQAAKSDNVGNISLAGKNQAAFSFWVKMDASAWDLKYSSRFIQQYQSYALTTANYAANNNRLHVAVYNTDSSGWFAESANLITGIWYHVVVNIRAGSPIEIYLNGVSSISYTQTFTGTFLVPTSKVLIGGNGGEVYSTPRAMKGVIDEVAIWDRTLSQKEVEKLYNFGVGNTHPFDDYVSLSRRLLGYWKLDESTGKVLYSSYGSNHAALYSDGSLNQAGRIGSCVRMTNENNCLVLKDLIPAGNEYSFAAWIRMDTSTRGAQRRLQYSNILNNIPYTTSYDLFVTDAGERTYVYVSNTDGSVYSVGSNTVISPNIWYHVVQTVKTGQPLKIYINGVDNTASSVTYYGTMNQHDVSSLIMGINNSRCFPGCMDEVGIWTKALTAREVSLLYNDGVGLPYPFTSLNAGLNSYYKLDGSLGYAKDEMGKNDCSISLVLQNESGKIGQSYYFNDSVDGYVTNASANRFTGSFSLSCWFKTTQAGYGALVTNYKPEGINLASGWDLVHNNDQIQWNIRSGRDSSSRCYAYNTMTDASDGNWHHIVAIYDISMAKFYYDGAFKSSAIWRDAGGVGAPITPFEPLLYSSAPFRIGNRADGIRLTGNVDEVGLWNRALSNVEVSTLYNNGSGITYPFI